MQKQQNIKNIKITTITNNTLTYIINNVTVVSIKPNDVSDDVLKFLEHNNLKDYYSVLNRIDDFYLKLNN